MIPDALRTLRALLEAVPNISQREKGLILQACEHSEALEDDCTRRSGTTQDLDLRLVTASEAARQLGTSKRMIWHLAREKKLPRIKLGKRCTRFRLRDLRKMVDGQAESPPAHIDGGNEDSP